MIFTFSETSQWGSTISFFNTDDFQKWSIVNHDVKHGGTWKTYKQPAKDYINKYVKDIFHLLIKIFLLNMATDFLNFKVKILVQF